MIALRDIQRSKLKFGLLAAAVALLVFLLLFLNTVSNQLIGSLVGAIENSTADVLVVTDESQGALPASRIAPDTVEDVAGVDGVAEAVGVGIMTTTASIDGETRDFALWGLPVGGPGFPDNLLEGRLPEGSQEIVVDVEAKAQGATVGATVTLEPSGLTLTVVGVVNDATYFITPTGYTDPDGWRESFEAQFPGTPTVPLSAIAVATTEGADAEAVATDITESIDGLVGRTPDALAAATPGADSLTQSFSLIIGITFLVVVLLVGFFFLILTVQKLRPYTTLRALGASTAQMGRSVMLQITVLVLAGVAIAAGLLWLASLGSSPEFTISFDPMLVLTATVAVLVTSLLAGLFSVRRIAREDPSDAAFGGGR